MRQLRPIVTRAGTVARLPTMRDARVQALGLVAVRLQVVAGADHRRPTADAAVLVDDRPVDARPAPPPTCRTSRSSRAPRRPARPARPATGCCARPCPPPRSRGSTMLRLTRASRSDPRRRPLLAPGVDQPAQVVQLDLWLVREQVEVGRPVALDRPDVLPVALELVRVRPATGLHHPGQQVAPEVDPIGDRHVAQHVPARRRRRPC